MRIWLCLSDERLDELVVNSLLHEHAASADAGLACGNETAEGDALGRDVDGLIVKHDDG